MVRFQLLQCAAEIHGKVSGRGVAVVWSCGERFLKDRAELQVDPLAIDVDVHRSQCATLLVGFFDFQWSTSGK